LGRHQQAALISFGATVKPAVVIAFQYNPEMLTRSFVPPASQVGISTPTQEQISFTMALDAIDLGAEIDPVSRAFGILPTLTALAELIKESRAPSPPTIFLVWGPHRLLPVQFTDLVIRETTFNEALAPLRAEVDVVLRVLEDIGEGASASALKAWKDHQAAMKKLPATRPGPIPDYLNRMIK
jgi:hypothetical protein